ncbi:hypothetical protein NMY22_g3784 [Coprinellus aureogranulatus]|nr:hypothetical protein NMY22_g3784 [Coprinellus aureogranulatus]
MPLALLPTLSSVSFSVSRCLGAGIGKGHLWIAFAPSARSNALVRGYGRTRHNAGSTSRSRGLRGRAICRGSLHSAEAAPSTFLGRIASAEGRGFGIWGFVIRLGHPSDTAGGEAEPEMAKEMMRVKANVDPHRRSASVEIIPPGPNALLDVNQPPFAAGPCLAMPAHSQFHGGGIGNPLPERVLTPTPMRPFPPVSTLRSLLPITQQTARTRPNTTLRPIALRSQSKPAGHASPALINGGKNHHVHQRLFSIHLT